MLIAPAGYGKTFAAREIGRRWQPSTYCDVRRAKTAYDVASCILTTMAAACPDADRVMLKSAIEITTHVSILADAIRSAWQMMPPESLLIVDHVDGAQHLTEVYELLNAILEHRLDSRSILLCARSRPRLHASRFAAPHEQLLYGAEHLRFSPDEIRGRFAQTLTDAEFEAIERITNGWPIGVLFLARAVKEGNLSLRIAQMQSGTIDVFEDYFNQELLRDIDPVQLNALVALTATLELTDAETALALGESPSTALAIFREVPFVVRDRERGVHRLNPLLRNVVERRYAVAVSNMRRQLERGRRTSSDRIAAIRFFFEREQHATAADLIESASMRSAPNSDLLLQCVGLWGFAMTGPSIGAPTTKWVRNARALWSHVRNDEFAVRSAIVGAYAKTSGALGFYGEGRAALDQYESSLSGDDRPFGEAILTLWRTAYAVWEGQDVDVDRATPRVAFILRNEAINAFWLHDIVARHWQLRGERAAEAAALEAAHDSALREGLTVAAALVTADLAFHRWFAGDDAAYRNAVDALVDVTDQLALERVGFFTACCQSRAGVAQLLLAPARLRAAGYVIAASQSADRLEARSYATAAIAAADEAGAQFLQIISRVAAAFCEQLDDRDHLLRQALIIASTTSSQPLTDALAALIQKTGDVDVLTALIHRFSGSPPQPSLHLSVFRLQLKRNGCVVALQPREAEVLVALAVERRGLERERLADRVWPNHTTSNAMNSLKAYVSRLRRKFGAPIIVSTQLGYVLSPSVTVDVDEIESLLAALSSDDSINDEQRRTLRSVADVDLETLASRFVESEWFVPVQYRLEAAVRAACLALARDGLARRAWAEALSHANRIFVRDRFDEVSCRLTIRALRGLGDQIGAIRVLNQHENALKKELGIANPERLRELLTDEGVGSIAQAT